MTTLAACLRDESKQVQPVNPLEVFVDIVQSILGTGKDSPHPLSGIDKTLAAVQKERCSEVSVARCIFQDVFVFRAVRRPICVEECAKNQ